MNYLSNVVIAAILETWEMHENIAPLFRNHLHKFTQRFISQKEKKRGKYASSWKVKVYFSR